MPLNLKDISVAHIRESDRAIQALESHLRETSTLCSLFASSIGLPLCGRLIGLLHDLGKYSAAFQIYIREGCGFFGEEGVQRAKAKQGRIDHATAGAQHVWNCLASEKSIRFALAQILSVTLMSHHSRTGMKDFVALDGKSPFLDRLNSCEKRSHLAEVLAAANPEILSEVDQLLSDPRLQTEFKNLAARLENSSTEKIIRFFNYSLVARFLFSCLLDADRINTADFEKRKSAEFRNSRKSPDWNALSEKLEHKLNKICNNTAINRIRKNISDECRDAATRLGRLFTLPVPTGGGKTLASLRFALRRATWSNPAVERIIYIIPYTSIIDQNAEEVREILGKENVLEHHSNIAPEADTWRNRVLSENWNAPVVFTTSVQLLNALFNQSTSSARRMHQLANSIVVFDEIQTLPVRTIHCFNNAINFLTSHCNTTVVLCTATMPLLDKVNPRLGAIPLTPTCDLITDKKTLFKKLKRTEIIDNRRAEKWTHQQIRNFALEVVSKHQSVLVVCNTKDSAQRLYQLLLIAESTPKIVHLSTSMCPAHRKDTICEIKSDLKNQNPVICVSTQLIEAGVDLDFGCVIRSLAGMDSIIQAGGRCNRHGTRKCGPVFILNFAEEPLGTVLREIASAQQDSERVLNEFLSDPKEFDEDLLSEATMMRFYRYHFYRRSSEMLYPLKANNGKFPIAADTSILELLSENLTSLHSANRQKTPEISRLPLQQAYSTAAQAFEVIDAPTQGIIVPYNNATTCKKGSELIANLAAAFGNANYPLREQVQLLKLAQQFTVNAFPHVIKKLDKQGAIREIHPESGIYHLDKQYYHRDLGVTLEALSEQDFYHV